MRKKTSPQYEPDINQSKNGRLTKDDEVHPSFNMGRYLHHTIVGRNAAAMAIVSVLFVPFAIYAFMLGESVPLMLSFIMLVVSAIGIFSGIKKQTANHASNRLLVELVGLVSGGLVLTIADPAWVDPGLGILLLSLVHLAFTHRQFTGHNYRYVLLFLTLFCGLVVGTLLPNLVSSSSIVEWTGALFLILVTLIQMYTVHCLSKFGQEKDQAHNDAVRHIAEQMGNGYARFSIEGRVLFVSEPTHDLLGTTRFGLSEQGVVDRVHVLDRPRFLKGLSDAVHSNSNEIIEIRIRKDGSDLTAAIPEFMWVEVHFSPLADPGIEKESWQIVALFRDVSARKDREFELIEARKNAEIATKTKSGFLATIGHELRTPLNAIVGFSEMMTNEIGGKLEPAHEEYTKLIFQSGHHLLDVVNMLLDMSKIEAGKFELQLTSFEPADLVRPCMQMVENNAQSKDVQLALDLQENLPALTGDERACRQILINLLSNAVKFS
ncbi:MAG: hypothetical protein L3J13_09555, partial [Devosiaceae bacterium]|nr:hypothetical protein [Devosiaceae bacterium]